MRVILFYIVRRGSVTINVYSENLDILGFMNTSLDNLSSELKEQASKLESINEKMNALADSSNSVEEVFGGASVFSYFSRSKKRRVLKNPKLGVKKSPGSHFGMRLRQWREQRNLTQRQLEVLLGVSRGGISSWESGYRHPMPEYQERLADSLEISIEVVKEAIEISKKDKEVIDDRFSKGETYQKIAESYSYCSDPGERLLKTDIHLPLEILSWVKRGAKEANMSVSAYIARPIARAYYAKKRGRDFKVSYDDGPDL